MADGSWMKSRYRQMHMTEAEGDKVNFIMRLFTELQIVRSPFNQQWDETAQLISPGYAGTFQYGQSPLAGEKRTDRQLDTTGMIALSRFSAICDSLLTPRNGRWHMLTTSDPYLNKQRRVKLWLEEATRLLFQYRYRPTANFSAQNQLGYKALGAFGTTGLYVDDLAGRKGLRYKDMPPGEMYYWENHQGIIEGFIRHFKFKAHQAIQVPEWKGRLPDCIYTALEKGSQQEFQFLHYVAKRGDFDPDRIDIKGMEFESVYISLEGKCFLAEGGYRTFPVATGRYEQYPNEVYGRAPAMLVLPSLKSLNVMKRLFLKQGHRAADPVILLADDGLADFNMRPGAKNFGGVNSDGKPLAQILPTGQIQVTEEMMDKEAAPVNDVFLVSLFQILAEQPRMTATEVIERTNEKGILLAPTVGRQHDERHGPLIERELDLLVRQRVLPPMPPEMAEAGGEYEVEYTSPLAKAAKAQETAGFFRVVEGVRELVNVTQDPSLLDRFDFDTAIPAIADNQGVPESFLASDEMVADKRERRAEQQRRQEQIQAAPAAAALKKADVAAAEAGVPMQ